MTQCKETEKKPVSIPQKEDLTDCADYRTSAVITNLSSILLLIILKKLNAALEGCVSEEQGRFTTDRSTVQ